MATPPISSSKGTIGRFCFLISLIFYGLSPILELFATFAVSILSNPLGSEASGYIWTESQAGFVRDYLGWITVGWRPAIAVIGSYLVADWVFSRAYIRRARAIGVEIPSTWMIYSHFLGFERGATLKDLLLSRDTPK